MRLVARRAVCSVLEAWVFRRTRERPLSRDERRAAAELELTMAYRAEEDPP